MEAVFAQVLSVWAPLIYVAIFLGMIIEGEAVLFTAVFLAHQGGLSMPLVLVVSAIGLFVGDFSWFLAGAHLIKYVPFLERFSHKVTGIFDRHLEDRPLFMIFLSKFAYGINHALLLRAGQRHMSLKACSRIIIISNIIWFSLIVGAAIWLSASIGPIRHFFKYAKYVILAGILLFVFFERIATFVTELFIKD